MFVGHTGCPTTVPNQSKMTTKWAKSMRFSTPVAIRKTHFVPLFTPFWSQNGSILRLFWYLQAVKMAQIGLKTGEKQIYRHPKQSGVTFGEKKV